MNRNIVKTFCGKGEILVLSENGKAVSFTGNFERGAVRTDLDAKYNGPVLHISRIGRTSLRKIKPALELMDIKEIRFDGIYLLIGGYEIGADEVKSNALPDILGEHGNPVETHEFDAEGVKRIMHIADCASRDTGRLFMNGVYFAKNGDIASTDSHVCPVWRTKGSFGKIMVYYDAFEPFKKSKKLEMKVYGIGRRTVVLTDGKTTVYSMEIDGDFPNYMKLIPGKGKGYVSGKGVYIDYKKFGNYIKSTGSKYVPASVDFVDKTVWCNGIAVGTLGFSIDPLRVQSDYIKGAVEFAGDNVSWVPVNWKGVVQSPTSNEPFISKALLFGDTETVFELIAPNYGASDERAAVNYVKDKAAEYAA